MLTNIFSFENISAKTWIFAKDTFFKGCHVLTVLSRLPIGRLVQSNLSLLSGPSCPVPDALSKCSILTRLSCSRGPVLAVLLFQLPCPGHIGHCSPDTMSCPGSPVISVITRLTCLAACRANLSRLSCPDCPVLDVLSQLACPSGPVPDVLFQLALWSIQVTLSYLDVLSKISSLKCRGCSIPVVLSSLSCPCCHILAVLPLLAILTVLSRPSFWLSCPSFSVWLSCPGCLVPAVLSRLSCPGGLVPAVLSKLFCPAALSQPSHPGCSVPAALSQQSCSCCSA